MNEDPIIHLADEQEPEVSASSSTANDTAAAADTAQGSAPRQRNTSRRRTQKASQAFSGVWQGRILSLDLFRRNFLFIIVAVGMMLMYIGNKFECQNKMLEVMNLKKELENAKTDCVNASARYNSLIRESNMKAYVDTMHIYLSNPELPPYHLSKK